MLASMRFSLAPPQRAPLAFLLGMLSAAGALGCGEEVLLGRWVLRSSPVDAGLAGDAGPPDNPQSVNAERARQHAHDRETNKNDPHDNRPDDEKSH